jgi:hypothetical protein
MAGRPHPAEEGLLAGAAEASFGTPRPLAENWFFGAGDETASLRCSGAISAAFRAPRRRGQNSLRSNSWPLSSAEERGVGGRRRGFVRHAPPPC